MDEVNNYKRVYYLIGFYTDFWICFWDTYYNNWFYWTYVIDQTLNFVHANAY